MPSVRTVLNNGNPNSVDHAAQVAALGEALALLPRTIRAAVVSNKVVLPENAKAARILTAYGIGGTSGYLLPLAVGSAATPSTTQISVDAQGNLVVASADALTVVIVTYHAVEGEVFQEQVTVASNVATLLGSRRAALLLSANADAGTAPGAKTPVQRPATPTAGQAAIGGADDSTIAFASADAVTLATIRYIAIPGIGQTQRLSVGANLDLVIGGV